MMKKVVVTGGAGFIGSHLAQALAGRGYHVIIIDDLSTGRRDNLAGLLGRENIDLIVGSITDLPLLQERFAGIEYVFHLAAIPSVPRSIKDPMLSNEVNITGTLNVLLAARDCGVKKVIYSSSSSVYGDTPTLPKQEAMPPNPQSPYAVAKITGEYYCQVFAKVYGLATVALRYFNVYGPRQDPDSQYAAVIPSFIVNALHGKPPVIFGDGEQTRDFTFVKDAVAANLLAAEGAAAGVFNVGTGSRVSINQLAELVINLSGSNIKPDYREKRPGDILHSLADISQLGKFGYKPGYTFEEGLKETVRSFQHAA
ncbi:MAG: SDR family oxidoreductase [Dehalococcoidales bacterium]|nr:SDR family oxidoreductase [Dehalococcoidales bacterium]